MVKLFYQTSIFLRTKVSQARARTAQKARILPACLLIVASLFACEAPALSFSGPEVLKLDWSTRSLNVSDVDNDGLSDLVLINNDTAKIEILYQLAEGEDRSYLKKQLNRNRWEPVLEDARFEVEGITVGFSLFDLVVGDLNGDGRDDFAYTGREHPLTIRFQSESGAWVEKEEFNGFEATGWAGTLKISDIDADGDAELIVISADGLRIIDQGESGQMYEREFYYITGQNPFNLKIEDVTNDGRPDILYITSSRKQSLVLREQLEEGGFGPELRFPFEQPVRSVQILPRVEDLPVTLCSVDSRSGRLEFFRLEKQDHFNGIESLLAGPPKIYPILKKGRLAASYVLGDLNGDGLEDLLVANPDEAEWVLFLKGPDHFQAPQTFPSFSEISSMGHGRFFESDRKAIVVLSVQERMIGISQMSPEGRLEFPRQLIVGEGDPLVCRAVNLDGDAFDELALVNELDGVMSLVLARPVDRANKNTDWEIITRIDLEDVKRKPIAIREVAIFENNRPGLMVFVPREAPVLLSVDDSEGVRLTEIGKASTVRESLLKDVQPVQVSVLDIDEDGRNELVVGRTGYARALRVTDGILEMVDQFNARRSEDVVSAIIPFYNEDRIQQLAFYIEGSGEFQLIERNDDGVFRYSASTDVGTIDLSGWYQLSDRENAEELILAGADRFWNLKAGSDIWTRVVESSYETTLEDVFYSYLEGTDFDQDGFLELVVVDGQNHVVEILSEREEGWLNRMFWEIFEQNLHYQGRNGSKIEPRQVVIADLTNDGKPDFAFLVHDRILIYPQD